MGRLTTHVLDTTRGRPAAGLLVELFDGHGRRLADGRTNADGRLDAPLLEGDDLISGIFELRFHVGDWLAESGLPLPQPPFLDVVPVRFGIADPSAHHHVPLLVSPYGYSTYRGS